MIKIKENKKIIKKYIFIGLMIIRDILNKIIRNYHLDFMIVMLIN
jgi:hypothetical protein